MICWVGVVEARGEGGERGGGFGVWGGGEGWDGEEEDIGALLAIEEDANMSLLLPYGSTEVCWGQVGLEPKGYVTILT